ncbi:MAG: hydantoinase/oxoprolinase family protein, partial [Planctomycetes bacterium]|nr:hydantoinase/oxoprolinase family protein [Planctomycetota bacterium]
MAATRIGIDTGGTFTDIVRWSRRGVTVHKLPSTPDDPARAVLAGLMAVRRRADEEVDVVHGTTVGLNAVLTGRIAKTAFVTNTGFEDVVEIGRQERDDIYALEPARPEPPVPRRLRVGVRCRRGPDGRTLVALEVGEIERCVARLARLRPAAVAIGLLHSPADPRDEQRLARAVRRALPNVPVTCSAELLPAFGEYERFCAAILNAAIAPIVSGYTARLDRAIGSGRLRLLRSSLGIMPGDEAAAFPTRAMFSGPAGGVLATARVAALAGLQRAAAFDMGGTSADVCLVDADGAATLAAGTIAGLPLPVPTVPIHTVGCGGGSIAYVDAGGALRVGPESAGADPGPACYGRSSEPTVTDAHVALGHLGADTLLAGGFPIDVDAAVRAIERLAKRLGMSTAAAARGILEVADIAMARAILVITAARAIDPAGVPLVPYGGAGALHAAGLIGRLGMPSALVPADPGAFSALGLALAGESAERSRAVRAMASAADRRQLAAVARDLADEVRAALPAARRVR